MNFNIKKSSQISIFIIISISIIFLFIFLLTSNSDQKKENLSKIKTSILTENNQKLFPLKDNVDFCLSKQLKRALIISGMKGGFIYDKGEYYSNSVILQDTYKESLIKNLNLNWNKLIENVLIYFQTDIYIPQINYNGTIYSHSIKDDYKKFILDEFLKCIDLSSYENSGYQIIQEDFSGLISNIIDEKTAKTNKIIGKLGNKIKITILNKDYFGNISSVNDKLNYVIIKFQNPVFNNLKSNIDFQTIKIRNLDSQVNVSLKFNDEDVTARLYFPILIKKNNFSTSYKISNIKEPIRFKKYLQISKLLLNAKKNNRSLDYSKKEDIEKILNQDPYFRKTQLKNYKIIETKLNNSNEYKKYIYSIVDKDSKIFGNSYIFNFAYENNAPKIDLSKLNSKFFSDNQVLFIAAKNIPFNINLKNLIIDKQYFDNFNKINFIPDSKSSALFSYSLDEFGNLKFLTSIQNRFSFKIGITDGETTRKQEFVFISGFPENKENQDADSCLKFENYGNKNFPINSKYENKIYKFKDSNNFVHNFAYSIFANQKGLKNPNIGILNSKVSISKSCLGNGIDLFDIKANYKDLYTNTITPFNLNSNNEIIISNQIKNPIEINLGVYIKNSNKLVNSMPFKLEVYPSKCLGPKKYNSSLEKQFGGLGSCCNLDKVPIIRASSQINFIDNLLKNKEIATNVDSYFTFSVNPNGIFPNSYDFTNKNIWNDFGADATSLFEGKIISKCGGIFPKYQNNIVEISSQNPSYSSDVKSFFTNNNFFKKGVDFLNIPINLKINKNANKCEFSKIENYADFNILTNDKKVLNIGFKFKNLLNPQNYISTIPNTPDYDNTYILCDNNYYATTKTNPFNFKDWEKNANLGIGGNPSIIYKSRGYCQAGNNKCSGKVGSPTIDFKFDNVNSCIDYSIENSQKFIKNKNSGWICNSYNEPICDKTDPNNPKIIYTKKDLVCDGSSFSCPAPPDFSNFICN